MRLVEIQSSYRTSLITDEAVAMAKEYFYEYFSLYREPVIYRGRTKITDASPISIVDPKAVGRISQNTTNEYTALMSDLPSWSRFPKRSQSIICSNAKAGAATYGPPHQIYAVILPATFRLGVCDEHDVWASFPYVEKELGADPRIHGGDFGPVLTYWIRGIMVSQMLRKGVPKIVSFQDLQAAFSSFDASVEQWGEELPATYGLSDNLLATYIVRKMVADPSLTAFSVLADLLDPVKNRFELITSVQNLPSEGEYDLREVWTDSICLMMPVSLYSDFRERVLTGD